MRDERKTNYCWPKIFHNRLLVFLSSFIPHPSSFPTHIISPTDQVGGRHPLKRTILMTAAALGLFLSGCGGGGEKGKNRDKDMPVPPEAKKG